MISLMTRANLCSITTMSRFKGLSTTIYPSGLSGGVLPKCRRAWFKIKVELSDNPVSGFTVKREGPKSKGHDHRKGTEELRLEQARPLTYLDRTWEISIISQLIIFLLEASEICRSIKGHKISTLAVTQTLAKSCR